jgi:hypothetical protein
LTRHRIEILQILPDGTPINRWLEADTSAINLDGSGRLVARLVDGRDEHGPLETTAMRGVWQYTRRPAPTATAPA